MQNQVIAELKKEAGALQRKFFIVVRRFPKSALTACPVERMMVPNQHCQRYFKPVVNDVTEPQFLAIFTLEKSDVAAYAFTWRSWLGRRTSMGIKESDVEPGLRDDAGAWT